MTSARSCLPPQVSSWWSQNAGANPYTALGPTFVCPEAYSAVQTVVVNSALEEVFCCPSYVHPLLSCTSYRQKFGNMS